MLLQALAQYADSRLKHEQKDPAFVRKRIGYVLNIGNDGEFLGIEEFLPVTRPGLTNRRTNILRVPRLPHPRTSGAHPFLGCDNAGYVLGFGEKHVAFTKLLEEAAAATSDPALCSCVGFFGRKKEVNSARREFAARNTKPGAWIALSVNGPVIERKRVRTYWRRIFARELEAAVQESSAGMCLISGQQGPVVRTHAKITGVTTVGGNSTGVSLISFGQEAYQSYGWRQAENSPVAPDRADAYTLALNHLLREGRRARVDHGNVAFVAWTRQPVVHTPLQAIEWPDKTPVGTLREIFAERNGQPANDFYLLGISGNAGRLIVRCWFQLDLTAAIKNVAAWFQSLRISDPFSGTYAEDPSLPLLLASISRTEPPPDWPVALMRRAVLGEPIGIAVLAAALRARRDATGCDALSPARAGFIRMCLNDQRATREIPPSLDSGILDSAYHLGRLLALYDVLQYYLQHRKTTKVSDLLYRVALSRPVAAAQQLREMGKIYRLQQESQYPRKLSSIAVEISEIQSDLDRTGFPEVFSLEGQAHLALGFHHQAAANKARAAARDQNRPDRKLRRRENE